MILSPSYAPRRPDGRGWSVERVHEHMAKCYVGFKLRELYEAEASGKPTRRPNLRDGLSIWVSSSILVA